MTLTEFMAAEKADRNAWWRLDSGDHLNLFEEAIDLLREARAEIDRWGHGDMHYGPMPRDKGVLAMLAKIDAAIGAPDDWGKRET